MRVTFVAVGAEQLPVSLLAAIAKRDGHEVGLAFSASLFDDRYQLSIPWLARIFDDRHCVIDAIRQQRPDVLAFSVLTNNYVWMLGIAREAKEMLPGVKVVFGGVHPSAAPDVCLARDEVDFVCVGEGDIAFPTLLRALERGEPHAPIPNMRFLGPDGRVVRGPQAGFVQDLDQLPFFDKQIWEEHVRVGDHYMTMASRGCPFRCTFCFNNFFARLPEGKRGRYVRQRSVDHMMGELLAAKRRYKIRFIDFEDDIFTVDRGWLREFLGRYKREIDKPFQCLVHPKYIDDEVARLLYESGCTWVQMGVQSADEEFRTTKLKRYEDNDRTMRAIDALNKSGVKLKSDHIFGLPGEPAGSQEEARQLYAAHTPARISTFWATFFPGTEMVEQAVELGLLTGDDVADIDNGHVPHWHSQGHVESDEHRRYRAYQFVFRLLPMVPRPLRDKVRAAPLEHLPGKVVDAAASAVDVANAVRTISNEHLSYAQHYLSHMGRSVARALGTSLPPPTRPHGPEMVRAARQPTSVSSLIAAAGGKK